MLMGSKNEQIQPSYYQSKQTLTQKLLRDNEGHYIIIKGLIHEDKVTTVDVYAPNAMARYVKHINESNGKQIPVQ